MKMKLEESYEATLDNAIISACWSPAAVPAKPSSHWTIVGVGHILRVSMMQFTD